MMPPHKCRISQCQVFPSRTVMRVRFCEAHGTIIESLLTEALVVFVERLGAMCNDIETVGAATTDGPTTHPPVDKEE